MKFGFGARNGRALRQRDPDLVRALQELEELKAATAHIPDDPAPPAQTITLAEVRDDMDELRALATQRAQGAL